MLGGEEPLGPLGMPFAHERAAGIDDQPIATDSPALRGAVEPRQELVGNVDARAWHQAELPEPTHSDNAPIDRAHRAALLTSFCPETPKPLAVQGF
jgi:hypothetical protein